MKTKILSAACLALAGGLATSANAAAFLGTANDVNVGSVLDPVFGVLVNFDELGAGGDGTAVGAGDYAGLGVSSITETELGVPIYRFLGPQSQPLYIGTGDTVERGTDFNLGWDGTIEIKLAQNSSKVGIGIANSQGDHEVVNVYDSAHNLLESFTPGLDANGQDANEYVYFVRGQGDIRYIEVKGDFFALDDLQHQAPDAGSTAMLLGFGLTAMLAVSRKFKKA